MSLARLAGSLERTLSRGRLVFNDDDFRASGEGESSERFRVQNSNTVVEIDSSGSSAKVDELVRGVSCSKTWKEVPDWRSILRMR